MRHNPELDLPRGLDAYEGQLRAKTIGRRELSQDDSTEPSVLGEQRGRDSRKDGRHGQPGQMTGAAEESGAATGSPEVGGGCGYAPYSEVNSSPGLASTSGASASEPEPEEHPAVVSGPTAGAGPAPCPNNIIGLRYATGELG